MAIAGTGIDGVEVERIERALTRHGLVDRGPGIGIRRRCGLPQRFLGHRLALP